MAPSTSTLSVLLCGLVAVVALLSGAGCDDKADPNVAVLKLSGKTFKLDLALDDERRFRGLSGKTEIKPDGGLLFVFPERQVRMQSFVMRDCLVPIDIIYLDRAARVTAFHKMTVEEPRKENEKELKAPFPGAPEWTKTNDAYEDRLKKYPSKHASQFVIEIKGGTLDDLKIKEGDKIELVGQTWEDLKKRAK